MSVRLQTQDFDIGAEIDRLVAGRTDVGAVVTFTGLVRDTAKGEKILDMTLDHYPGMCEAELERIEQEAHRRFSLQGSLIVHRYGTLFAADRIVLVVTLSEHRHEAFAAAEFLMDFLKTRAPFWKRETGADGSGHWVDAREADDEATGRWG
ncbi:MAG: molybdenum cofactor biosynthesis protein MoaE [Ancalomicrobiaceae bacterium]|nr:molybdenum cofactor biosynthesis protein MoaE [Ancalomicrobiaceae bacterium]